MAETAIDSTAGRSGGKMAVERLLVAIGYPERTSKGSVAFTLRVDGVEVVAEEMDERLVLLCSLSDDETLLPTLATYAAGRMLKENATLAYGNHSAFLWQDVPANADSHALLRLFETFMDSCDWWRARIDALRGNGPAETSAPETMVIRP